MGQRLLALDALRGLAVLLMIEQHLGVWLWEGPAPGKTAFDYPALLVFNALGGGAAPLFIVLAGVGSTLLTTRRASPDRTLVLRGIVVLGFGYLLSLLTPSWFTWRSWFVLHLMGLGMVATPALRRLPTAALLGLAAATLIATPFVQDWLDTPGQLSNPRMAGWVAPDGSGGVVLPGGHLRLALAESQFPVLPWLALFLVGLASGRWIAQQRPRPLSVLGAASLILGGAMALTWVGSPHGRGLDVLERAFRFNIPFFPASPAQVLILMGLVLLAIRVALAIEHRRDFAERGFLVVLGRASLTLLLLHVVLFRELSRPVDLWQALPAPLASSIMVGFVLLAALAARAWQRVGYRGGAEWILRRVAP